MKIIRHIAPDMRAAMRSIRAQLGEDAVILSSRKIPEGVEVTAAIDFEKLRTAVFGDIGHAADGAAGGFFPHLAAD